MKALRTFLFVATAALFTLPALHAQTAPASSAKQELSSKAKVFGFKGAPLKAEELLSPDFTIKGTAKNFRPENWLNLEAEVKFNLKADPRQLAALEIGEKDKYFGPVVVKFYILVKDPNNASSRVRLEKEVTYMDIPTDRPTYFSVLMSPVTVSRLTGGVGSGKALPQEMGYEVRYNDDLIGVWSTKRGLSWWNVENAKITSDTQGRYRILNKSETPFAMLWWDRYPSIKTVDSTKLDESMKSTKTLINIPDPEPEGPTAPKKEAVEPAPAPAEPEV